MTKSRINNYKAKTRLNILIDIGAPILGMVLEVIGIMLLLLLAMGLSRHIQYCLQQ
jgi:hypothetical protein